MRRPYPVLIARRPLSARRPRPVHCREPSLTLPHYTLLRQPNSPSGEIPRTAQESPEFSKNPETIPGESPEATAQSAYIEVSPTLLAKLHTIVNTEAFAVNATLQSAFTHVNALVMEILTAPTAYAAWRIDDLEEQLASAHRIADQLATNTPGPSRGDKISDPPIYDGNRDTLEGFVAQLRLKLFSDPTRFPTTAIRMAYTFNRLQGHAQAQVLPFVKGENIELKDAEEIIQILHNAFGEPDPVATARAKLSTRKQGKKEFNTYFAEFQMLVSKLKWNEDAKLDAL